VEYIFQESEIELGGQNPGMGVKLKRRAEFGCLTEAVLNLESDLDF
jgi:hypothetical protein